MVKIGGINVLLYNMHKQSRRKVRQLFHCARHSQDPGQQINSAKIRKAYSADMELINEIGENAKLYVGTRFRLSPEN